ncbi:hypothetical protein Tco_0005912 [Tanacetum coccineum]
MMNELIRNKYDVTNHQVNVQFLLQLQPECQRFVALVKQSQELKTVSYHKLYDILKQHQNEVNKLRAERLAHTANPLVLVAQQQPTYHPQNHPTHYTHNSSTRSQQVATRNRGKAIVNSSTPTYDQEPAMVADDDEMLKEKEIDKIMALISLSFKKNYKPTNNNLRTSSNTSRENQKYSKDYRGIGYVNQKCSLIDKNDNDNYNVFANDGKHSEQPESVNDTYPDEQGDTNIPTDSLDMSNNEGHADQDKDDDLARERNLLASLIDKLKCEIDESKNHNKLLELSNKTLVDKLKGKIKDFKTKNKSLESSNNHFNEANNELSKTNQSDAQRPKKFPS